jgi:hypothetical protein
MKHTNNNPKMKWSLLGSMFLIGFSALFTACDDHDHDHDHKHDEGENINSVTLEFFRTSDTLADFTVTWSDEDGIGGKDPILPDTLRLMKDSTYTVKVVFEHLHGTAKHDVTAEIRKEANSHIVCFTPKTIIQAIVLEIKRTDKDGKNLELGLESTWKGIIPETGTVQLTLKHQPNTKNGSCSIGETDIEVDFPFVIE